MAKGLTVTQHWLRVPAPEWTAVKYGVKREFRTSYRSLSLTRVEKPTPVLAFKSGALGHDSKLMVLLESWAEPLGAISEESLTNEGVDTLAEFKVRWTATRDRRFDPLKKVVVYRVRPWVPGEESEWAEKLWNRLYPEDLRG